MQPLIVINLVLGILFAIAYAYQFLFLIISYARRKKLTPSGEKLRFAILISARNEEAVIGELLSSLSALDYPKDRYRVFLVADNCTDSTADRARECGAIVYERHSDTERGKGYALDFLIKAIERDYAHDLPDAYAVFDADNLVDKDFLTHINDTLTSGYDASTSYRASKNYGVNWVSAGQGMCFLRDMVMLNRARMAVGSCCFISGTGFAFTRRLAESYGGWPFHTLTEDGEFTLHCATEGNLIGYCDKAVFYDEQPTSFRESWWQRLRWCRGGIQVFSKYLKTVVKRVLLGKGFSCIELLSCMAPAYFISIAAVAANIVGFTVALIQRAPILSALALLGVEVAAIYLAFAVFSITLTATEWHRIDCGGAKKVLYALTFPFFMMTFMPIAITALFSRKNTWRPISHHATGAQDTPSTEGDNSTEENCDTSTEGKITYEGETLSETDTSTESDAEAPTEGDAEAPTEGDARKDGGKGTEV